MKKGGSPNQDGHTHAGRMRTALMLLCLVAGLALVLYPIVGTYLNERSFIDAVEHYEEAVSTMPEDQRQAELAAAHAYNDSLRGDPVHDPFVAGSGYAVPDNYDRILNVDGAGLMGTVDIPVIDVSLPLYHGTSDDVLKRGAGHLPQTSLPVGGAGTHAVITGHTGLPTARLFTDLEHLKQGDVFIIEVLGDKHAYEVDDIRIVDPDDVSDIRIDEQHDCVTLLTCTPYGVNSQRLLVRGLACDVPVQAQPVRGTSLSPWPVSMAVAALAVTLGCAAWFAVRRRRRTRSVAKGR